MAEEKQAEHIAGKRVLYTIPGMDDMDVRQVPYDKSGDPLMLDVYTPPHRRDDDALAAVVLVTGYSDAGARKMFGRSFSAMGAFVSWARLIAASGMIAVTYTNRVPSDVRTVVHYLRQHAAKLGIDPDRVGIWSCSGHGPNALSLLMTDAGAALRCAALCYPYSMDLDGSTVTAAAATQWGFVDACAGRSISDLSRDVALFIARAGGDQMPGLNVALDRFAAAALAANLPITLVNHPQGPHAFDLFHDSAATRDIIENILRFLRFHLAPEAAEPPGVDLGEGKPAI
jgi:hypothetical protein